MRDFETFNPKEDVFNKPLPSGARELCKRGEIGGLKETMSSWHNRTDSLGNHRDKTVTGQVRARWNSNTEKGEWTLSPIPNSEATYNWHPLAKEKLLFSNGVSLCALTAYTVAPWTATDGQQKQTQWYICRFFVSYCFVWTFFLSFWPFACIYYGFLFCISVGFWLSP